MEDQRSVFFGIVLSTLCVLMTAAPWAQAQRLPASRTEEQQVLEEKEAAEQAVRIEAEPVRVTGDLISQLPEDTTAVFTLQDIELRGNTLLSEESLLGGLPDVYNASTAGELEPAYLYDFRPVKVLLDAPGTEQPISARTIQGLTQYILSQYQKRGYAGIYVYVPAEAYGPDNAFAAGVLPIEIMEARVSNVSARYFDVSNQPAERSWLRQEVLQDWSPVRQGRTANRKQLDDYINLLNRNPDRYVSAMVSRGEEPNSLALTYNVYEANPWHYFVQIDNSGTEDVEWTPRFGLVNTNLLGYDDQFTAIYQAVPDSTWNEEYAVYGSYDFPLLTPRLRANLFAGYNEFDISDSSVANFLGRGLFAGGILRYNLFQTEDWFFDVTGTMSYEESKISTFLTDFPEIGGFDADIRMVLWGYGLELYRTTDMTDTFFGFNHINSLDTSGQDSFEASRTGTDEYFDIYTTRVRHSQYLDSDKVQRLSGAFSWITSSERLVPAKMTTFGGMYTVRGYDESEIIADGGILASVQYEYDLVRSGQVELFGTETDEKSRRPFLRKLAPLVFADYGQARVEDSTPAEHTDLELASVGGGVLTELGNHFMGTVYYGYPLIATDDTSEGKGRLHVGLLLRW